MPSPPSPARPISTIARSLGVPAAIASAVRNEGATPETLCPSSCSTPCRNRLTSDSSSTIRTRSVRPVTAAADDCSTPISPFHRMPRRNGPNARRGREGSGDFHVIALPSLQVRTAGLQYTPRHSSWGTDNKSMSADAAAILVVEDEFLVRMFAVDALEDAGFRVLQAGTAAEAMQALRGSPDVRAALVDIGSAGPAGRSAGGRNPGAAQPTCRSSSPAAAAAGSCASGSPGIRASRFW